MSINTDEMFLLADERRTTADEHAKCTAPNPTMQMCQSNHGEHYCVLPSGHDGLHMHTMNHYTVHLASWGTFAQWGITGTTITEPTITEPTDTADPQLLTFVYNKLREPSPDYVTDFSVYTNDECREQYNYARNQLLQLAALYQQDEQQHIERCTALETDRNFWQRRSSEHQADFEKFASMLLDEAERRGWCSDYEKFADEVNSQLQHNEVPPRYKEYTVYNTYTVTVYVTVSARDEDDAIEKAQNYSDPRFSDDRGNWCVSDSTDDSEWNAELA